MTRLLRISVRRLIYNVIATSVEMLMCTRPILLLLLQSWGLGYRFQFTDATHLILFFTFFGHQSIT